MFSVIISTCMLIALSHSDDSHVNATAPCMSSLEPRPGFEATCMSCTYMHFAQARPPMSLVNINSVQMPDRQGSVF